MKELGKTRVWGALMLLVSLGLAAATAQAQQYVIARPEKSDGVYGLLRRYGITPNAQSIESFWQCNPELQKRGRYLQLGQEYNLPIYRIYYDNTSIRSTLKISDKRLAAKIHEYNESVWRAGLQKSHYSSSRDLWVPVDWIGRQAGASEPGVFPLFGERYQSVTPESRALEGVVVYLDPGHGGPDPGAVGRMGQEFLYEDEYAYDISLRLARRLLQHGATVHLIVQDGDDGIRDDPILKSDYDEYYLGGIAIDPDQYRRLSDRADIINALYEQHKPRRQFLITLHVDSRVHSKRVDIFFYYQQDNPASERLADALLHKVEEKYAQKQPGRGYQGSVGTRDLLVLSESKPVPVYIEVGNIMNKKDQERLTIPDNRQAIANWLCEGLIEAVKL